MECLTLFCIRHEASFPAADQYCPHCMLESRFGRFCPTARQVVEGFITGLHQSPFHGFSVEFAG